MSDLIFFLRFCISRYFFESIHPKQMLEEIINLFKVLDTRVEDCAPYMDDDLSAFPYVNGELFADENI